MFVLLIILVIAIVLFFWISGIYNKYVVLDVENKKSFSDLGVFLQKRLDLIPNLVETVKGYAKHESETLEKVISARSQMVKLDLSDVDNVEKIQSLENGLTKTLRSIMALSESYPDLKANTNFIELQNSLKGLVFLHFHFLKFLEKEIEGARRYYNATAGELNIFVRQFPNVLLSGMFRFRNAELFKEQEEAKDVPKVSF